MNYFTAIVLCGLLLGGCAPKMGEDIIIEPVGNVRLENTGTEVVLGVLALLGTPISDHGDIKIGTDLKVMNKWHSDITIESVSYALSDESETIARGEAEITQKEALRIESGVSKTIPLVLRIDPEKVNPARLLALVKSKHKWFVKGEAVISIWGIQKHYTFEKEATKVLLKALKDV